MGYLILKSSSKNYNSSNIQLIARKDIGAL